MQSIRSQARLLLRRFLGRFGLELRHTPPVGADLWDDLRRLLSSTSQPLVFDIGANIGQFLTAVRRVLPQAVVHSFEPSPEVFQELRHAAGHLPGVVLNNVAMGSRREERVLFEHSASVGSSFLPRGPEASSVVQGETRVPVETVDAYCARRAIRSIDLLKIDTQGYDLEVLRGAEQMLSSGLTRLVIVELTFRPIYEGQAEPDALYRHLIDRGFRLVSLYIWWYTDGMAECGDALFVRVPKTPQENAVHLLS